jgi:hypothetical protein
MGKRPSQTAAEFLAQLERDPAFVARRAERDESLRRLAEADAWAEAPLVEALRAAGSSVTSVWDLVNTRESYPSLVPVLLSHLNRDYPERVREGIARALAVPAARMGWNTLVDTYTSATDATTHGIKWALHLAIAAAADSSHLDSLIRLATDGRHGRNRSYFVDALARIDDPRANAALAELASDPDLAESLKRVARKSRRLNRIVAGSRKE